MATIAPTQSAVQTALRAFLLAVLPSDVEVIAGVVNRVPEPKANRFVVMTPIGFRRLRTNVDTSADCAFFGSIAGAAMTVASVSIGALALQAPVTGPGIAAGTTITSQVSGSPGGPGSYTVSPSQSVASQVMSAGQTILEQAAEVEVQLDFHAADNTGSDLAQIASTALRDPYGVQVFEDQALGVAPLYADDPKNAPFINENQQYEWRWVLRAMLQVNQQVAVGQQYFDGAVVTLIEVDAVYPPT